MLQVNSLGFPQESLINKHLEDKIRNKRVRYFKVRKVNRCFKNLEKGKKKRKFNNSSILLKPKSFFFFTVALEDSCIFSKELFDCMNLGERAAWSVWIILILSFCKKKIIITHILVSQKYKATIIIEITSKQLFLLTTKNKIEKIVNINKKIS